MGSTGPAASFGLVYISYFATLFYKLELIVFLVELVEQNCGKQLMAGNSDFNRLHEAKPVCYK